MNKDVPLNAEDKTKNLIRKNLSVDLLVANEMNPNEMAELEFNMLYDNMENRQVKVLVTSLPA